MFLTHMVRSGYQIPWNFQWIKQRNFAPHIFYLVSECIALKRFSHIWQKTGNRILIPPVSTAISAFLERALETLQWLKLAFFVHLFRMAVFCDRDISVADVSTFTYPFRFTRYSLWFQLYYDEIDDRYSAFLSFLKFIQHTLRIF